MPTIEDAYKACRFDQPLEANDLRYRDLAEARGGNSLQALKRRLTYGVDEGWVHLAFLSHRGAGKTTELKRLCEQVEHLFHPFYFEANLELDPAHLTTEDLLITLALGVIEEASRLRWPLDDATVQPVKDFFAEVVKSTSWVKGMAGELATEAVVETPFAWLIKLKASLKGLLKAESIYRTEIREAFRRRPGALLDAVNKVLDAVNQTLTTKSQRKLLVVIDNLDRYEPKVIDSLLVERGGVIEEVRCHLVVTPPIALVYRPISERLEQYFDIEVMNTVRLRDKNQTYEAFDGPGHNLLLDALKARFDVEALIPDTNVRDRLISASGGAIRELLRLVRDAILRERGQTLGREAVESAVRNEITTMRDMINANGWSAVLAQIGDEKQINDRPECMDVLYHRLAFKYDGQGWYDIHPLVNALDEYKQARRARSAPVLEP